MTKGYKQKKVEKDTSREKIEDKVTEVMENKATGIVGEDGLTVFDFAELRDALVSLIDEAKLDERERIKIKLCKKYGVFKYLTLDEVLRALPISKSK